MRLSLALLTAAGLLAAAPALAQTPSSSAPPASPHHGRGGSPDGWREGMKARIGAHRAQEVADLSTVLRLKPDQQGALQAWLDAQHPKWGDRATGMGERASAAPETTAQMLDHQQTRLAERETRSKARLDATRRFYSALGPDQQQVFDALQRMRHGGHGRGHGGWGRGAGEERAEMNGLSPRG